MALDLSTLTAQEQAAAIYIGYYDRAPDPVGSDFWEGVVAAGNLSLAEIATDFSTQAETQAEHPFFADPTASAANAFISELYMNLFNRAPDADGLTFWSGVLQASIDGTGALSVGQIILEIIQGAQDTADGNDLTTIQNKIAVAKAWTDAAEEAGLTGTDSYANDAAAQASAKSIIDGVTDDAATVTAATTTITADFEPTFALAAAAASVDEGATTTFTLTTENVAAGTELAYTISGVAAADVTGGLTGTATVGADGTATISVALAADALTEGAETLTVALDNGEATADVTVNDTSLTPPTFALAAAASVDEGATATFTLTTENVAEGTELAYTISGVAAADVTGGLTGTATVGADGTATISVALAADALTEGAETLTVALDNGEATADVTVNDTSLSPATFTLTESANTVAEGGVITYTVTANGVVTEDTTFIVAVAGSDLGGAATAASATDYALSATSVTFAEGAADGSTQTFTVTANTDSIEEGLEGIRVSLLDSGFATVASETSAFTNVAAADLPQTFTLTTVTDSFTNFTGGTADDAFLGTMTFTGDALADSATLTAGDALDGGAGTDTLTITVSGSAVTNVGETATPTLQNIEKVLVRSFETDASAVAGAAGAIQEDSVVIDLSNADAALETVGTSATNNVEADVVFANIGQLTSVEMAGLGDLRVEYTAATVSGSSDAVSLTVSGVGATGNNSAVNLDGVETLNITSSGTASFLDVEADDFTAVTIAGASNLTVDLQDGDITSLDASAASGDLSVDLSAATTANLTAVTGGTGTNDTLILGGADVDVNSTTNNLENVSSFETLAVNSANTITMAADVSGITSFDLTDAGNQVLNLNDGYTGATTVDITGDAGDTIVNSANVDLTVTANIDDLDGTITGSDTGSNDVINATVDTSNTTMSATITDIDTLNILAPANGTDDARLTMVDANLDDDATMTVNASGLGSGSTLTFSAAAEVGGDYIVTGGAAADTITGGAGDDSLVGGAGADSLLGGAGDDSLLGGAGDDRLTIGAGDDFADGGAGDDVIIAAGNLSSADSIVGGEGDDTLQVTSIDADDFANVSEVENLQLTNGGSATLSSNLSFTTIDLTSGATNETVTLADGYTAETTISVDAADSVVNTGADAVITINASAGDLETGEVTITGADATGVINTVNATNDTAAATIDVAAQMTNVDVLNILDHTTAGNDLSVNLAAYATALTLDASALDTGEDLTITGVAGAALTVTSGAGADTLVLGTGNDNISAGAGNDTFTAGTNITYQDTIDGGDGTDVIAASALEDVDLQNTTNVETLTVTNGATLGAFAQAAGIVNVTVGDATAVSGVSMTSGVTYTDGGANTTITGGLGDDVFSFDAANLTIGDELNGTAGDDAIQLVNNTTPTTDSTGDAVTAVINEISNIDRVVVVDAADGDTAGDVTITMDNADGADLYDQTSLEVDASALDAGETLTFNADDIAETDETFNVTGGAGDDTITGGAADDTIVGGAGADRIDGNGGGDNLTGGSGADVFVYATTDSGAADADTITDFTAGTDKLEVTISSNGTAIDATDKGDAASLSAGTSLLTANDEGQYFFSTDGSQLAIDVDGNGLIQASDLLINLTGETGFASSDIDFAITGGAAAQAITTGGGDDTIAAAGGNDTITSGAGADTVNGLAGDNTVDTGAGDDIINVTTAGNLDTNDVLTGGTGDDELRITTAAATATLDDQSGIETVTIVDAAGGTDLILVISYTAADTQDMTIDASALDAGEDITVNLSDAEVDGDYTVTTGAGADTIFSGDGADTLTSGLGDDVFVYSTDADLFSVGNVLVDSITGGAGTDSIVIVEDSAFTIVAADSFGSRISGIETIAAAADNDEIISITLNDNAFEAGITTIDLSRDTDVTANNVINVSAETTATNDFTLIGSAGIDAITGGAGDDTITGGAGNDVINGGTGDDTVNVNAGTDVVTLGAGTDTVAFASDTTAAGASRLIDLATTGENITFDWSATGTFADLHIGSGAARTDGASAGDVSTAIGYGAGGAFTLAATDNVLLFADVANGLDGINTALGAGTTTVIESSASANFAAGDELLIVVHNDTTGFVEIGIVTIGGADGFNGTGETYEHVATVETVGITAAQVAATIDFLT